MKILVDTNILVAALAEKGNEAELAEELLESDNELYTSLLNIMELRTVLTKKKGIDQGEVEETVEEVVESVEIVIPDSSDFVEANKLQIESLLYPQDCLILQVAESLEASLVSFDHELVENGAKRPDEIL